MSPGNESAGNSGHLSQFWCFSPPSGGETSAPTPCRGSFCSQGPVAISSVTARQRVRTSFPVLRGRDLCVCVSRRICLLVGFTHLVFLSPAARVSMEGCSFYGNAQTDTQRMLTSRSSFQPYEQMFAAAAAILTPL